MSTYSSQCCKSVSRHLDELQLISEFSKIQVSFLYLHFTITFCYRKELFHWILTLKSHKIACYLTVSASAAPPVDLLLTGVPVHPLYTSLNTCTLRSSLSQHLQPPSLKKCLYFNSKSVKIDISTTDQHIFDSIELFT